MSLGFQPGVFEDGRQKFWGGLHAQDSEGIFQHRGPVFRMDFQLEKIRVCLMLSVRISVEFGMTNGLTFRGTLCCEARRSCKCILGDDHKKS